MIHVLAIVTAKPGMREHILEAYRANLPAVLAEAGCVAYEAVVDIDDPAPGFATFGPDMFVVVERWETIEALRAHGAAPHMKAYVGKIKEWTVDTAVHVLKVA
jgi:quinol monooxygenase YgiN